MKHLIICFLVIVFIKTTNSQTYYPLPTQNAYWTVYEWDENQLVYDDLVYTVDGDTLINGLDYTKVYQLNDHPTIYDTIRNLHCLMRQDTVAKKIWFIRSYLGETTEKLGYDLSVNVGDTVSLPAFGYQFDYDSVFLLHILFPNSVTLFNGQYRNYYSFISINNSGRSIEFVEGITGIGNTFPDRYYWWDPFHQSYTMCMHENGNYMWPANTIPIDTTHCSFNLVSIKKPVYSQIDICPNPANDYCFLNLPFMNNETEVTLIDIIGKPVYYIHLAATKQITIDLTQFLAGIYLIRVKTTTRTFYNKLIVKH